MDFSVTSRVSELAFSDLYLGHPTLGDRLADIPGAPTNPVKAGPALEADLDTLRQACSDAHSRLKTDEFQLQYDGVTYRVAVMPATGGQVFVLRKPEAHVRTLGELGVFPAHRKWLMTEDLVGLLPICGQMRSGKTTTGGGLIIDRLRQYGGVAVTAEDPIELPLEGEHGPGICYQTPVAAGPQGYAEATRRIVRYGANIIYLGEIRDAATAVEALRAGTNGHLVICTLHAESVVAGIQRLVSLVSNNMDSATAYALLAHGLAGIMHQTLRGEPKKLNATLLRIRDEKLVQNYIRNQALERIDGEVQAQIATHILNEA